MGMHSGYVHGEVGHHREMQIKKDNQERMIQEMSKLREKLKQCECDCDCDGDGDGDGKEEAADENEQTRTTLGVVGDRVQTVCHIATYST